MNLSGPGGTRVGEHGADPTGIAEYCQPVSCHEVPEGLAHRLGLDALVSKFYWGSGHHSPH